MCILALPTKQVEYSDNNIMVHICYATVTAAWRMSVKHTCASSRLLCIHDVLLSNHGKNMIK